MTAALQTKEPTQRDHLANLQRFLDATQTMIERAACDGVTEQTIRKRIQAGQLRAVTVGHQVRVWRDHVEA